MTQFIHLHLRTAFSLLEGAIKPKDLGKLCVQYEMPAVAITDVNNLFGSLELAQGLAKVGVQPIMGCQLDFVPLPQEGMRTHNLRPKPESIVLLAQNEQGYHNLLEVASGAYLESAQEGEPILDWKILEGKTDGLICLTGGEGGPLIQRILRGRGDVADQWLNKMKQLFPERLYIEIQRHDTPAQLEPEPALLKLAAKHNLPIVATNDVYFATRKMHKAHDALLCIADGAYVTQDDRRRVTPEHYFKSSEEMVELFSDLPEAIENTLNIAKRCSFMSPARAPILPRFGDIEEEKRLLKEQAEVGLQRRIEKQVFTDDMDKAKREQVAKEYTDRLAYELDVINGMGFPGYFLIVADFIEWTKDNDIPVGPGRGSGAGSVVAWSLLITDLDPLRYGLLFERFLNPERVSMPDFDIDFCQDRRDEVIRYVQQKYGASQVAQIITFGKLQARAVLRDVGRVLQLPYGQVDRITKLVPNNPAAPCTLQEAIDQEPTLREAIREEEDTERMVEIALQLEGLYRHASTHAAGVVIGDRPLVELLPLYRDPRSDMLVVQYSMKYAEAAGLVKFDFLGLKTLTVLETARKFIKENEKVELDLLMLPEGDEVTYKMLGEGDATGVFQLESSGMRDTLRKLKPDSLEDIIALVSLYRPGPMDNIPTYIARKHGREEPEYLHPDLEPILSETFGVMIYQEQVMQIAQKLASYSLGEADLLRRAMGKKIAAEMESQRALFTERSVNNGIKEATAKAIFDLMAKFASYGFNKSHAAAYALIAYQTAFLKANYPAEFLAASMTYDIQNTEKLAIFAEDSKFRDIDVLPPCINHSFSDFRTDNTEDKKAIRYALGALKNVGRDAMDMLISEREANGKFNDIFDVVTRVDSKVLNKRQMENLIRAGVFDSMHENRKQLFGSLEKILIFANATAEDNESEQDSLFAAAPEEVAVPKPDLPDVPDWTKTERLNEEFAAIGFFLSGHPMAGYVAAMEALRRTTSANLTGRLGSDYSVVKLAGIIGEVKYKRSQKGRFAFVGLSDETGTYEVSIFDETLLDNKRELLISGAMVVVIAEGKQDDSGIRLIAKDIISLEQALNRPVVGAKSPVQRFTISQIGAIGGLVEALGELKASSGSRVSLKVVTDNGHEAIISLSGFYNISLQEAERIEQMLEHVQKKAA
ncbi:MAG: DNA polymerase III subunit alpha [Rickettsiales bacterium]|nr:DNA polymerase III subunit alpha [Rickettsiales bacterium]